MTEVKHKVEATQLRCLGDDDPESVFTAIPVWRWIDKQVTPVEAVNVFTVMRELGEAVIKASPSLRALTEPRPCDPNAPDLFGELIERMVEMAKEALEEGYEMEEMRKPVAHGW